MKIRTISFTYQRKFNLGDFNSVDLACSLWAQIDPEEDEETCIQVLQDKCREHVRQEYHKVKTGSKSIELFSVNTTSEELEDKHYQEGLEPPQI